MFWDIGRLSLSKGIRMKPWGLGDFFIADIAAFFAMLPNVILCFRNDFYIACIASYFGILEGRALVKE